jgi:hypothetical protein
MKIFSFEKFESIKTPCQTPETQYSISIENNKIQVNIDLPMNLDLTEDEAKILEANIHNVMELTLSKYFK